MVLSKYQFIIYLILYRSIAEGEWSSQVFLKGSSNVIVESNIILSDLGADSYRIQNKTEKVSNHKILSNRVLFKDLVNGDPSAGTDNF